MIESFIAALAAHPDVEALTLAGSQTGLGPDTLSDYDLYIYSQQPLPLAFRQALAEQFAAKAELQNDYFGPGDEMQLKDGTFVDLMYRNLDWVEEEIKRVWVGHQARVGYSTAFVHNIKTSQVLFDKRGRFTQLKQLLESEYPQALQKAIITNNYPLLRSKLTASFFEQIEHAVQRKDSISLIHRTSALLESYFDILFALNKQTHPGEKRQEAWVHATCTFIPPLFDEDIKELTQSIGHASQLEVITRLLDHLDELLKQEGWLT